MGDAWEWCDCIENIEKLKCHVCGGRGSIRTTRSLIHYAGKHWCVECLISHLIQRLGHIRWELKVLSEQV